MKKFILQITLFISTALCSQVGINTAFPEATFDVHAKNHLGSVTSIDGILVPRVSDLLVGGTVVSQLVYLINDSGTFKKGFHYWNGFVWTPLSSNEIKTSEWYKAGTTTDSDGDKTASIYRIGTTGIGSNTTPNIDAMLDVNSSSKGFLPPRLTLSSTSLASPLTAHVAGMIVYNTATTGDVNPGLYINDGQQWKKLTESSETEGTVTSKQKYRGRNLQSKGFDKPTLKVPSMNMEFRFATYNGTDPSTTSTTGTTYIEVRLLSAPISNVTYYASMLWFGSSTSGTTASVTFTPTNWNVWSNAISGPGSWSNPWGFQYQISTKDGVVPGTNDLKTGFFYGFDSFNTNSTSPDSETFVLAFEQY